MHATCPKGTAAKICLAECQYPRAWSFKVWLALQGYVPGVVLLQKKKETKQKAFSCMPFAKMTSAKKLQKGNNVAL